MWKVVFQILAAVAIGVVFFYLLPADIKEKGLGLLKSFMPEIVEEKLEPLIYTPVERREKLINKLEDNITRLKYSLNSDVSPIKVQEELNTVITETEKIISKIKEANAEQGPINKVTTAVIKKAADVFSPPSDQTNPTPSPNQTCP